ncbi:MAG TPA: FAD-binding protein [Pyrinomonadaceae bacterium]|nr:FAD-binding protein [Pyrinomonadaceae bacterium]
MKNISRRGLLKGFFATGIVLGFDLTNRSWVTAAASASGSGDFSMLPPLDGTLATDPASLASVADDFGHIVHRTPVAVLRPGSVEDIVKVVRFARQHGIRIAGRGKGHTAFGQSQADAGVVIDISTLNQIHSITQGSADVDAGVVWRDLLLATTAAGLTPPVLTDYTRLTIGGTLSVGGVSGSSYRYGAQVDNVLELQVVTGEGELVTCSEATNRSLFEAALAGLGLCAIIVRATIRLVPAKERAQTLRLFYANVPAMLDDLRFLINAERFDHFRGFGVPTPAGGFAFFVECTSYYTSAAELPTNPLEGLNSIPGAEQTEDRTYFEFTELVNQLIDILEAAGLGGFPHPWLDLFVPDSGIDDFASQTIAALDTSLLLPGSLVLFNPFRKSRLKRPMLRVPDEEVFFGFDLLRTIPPAPPIVDAVLAENRRLYEQNRDLGGKFYTISAVRLDSHDWKKHFQPFWGQLRSEKSKHDPDNVLGPGPGVFV